MPTDHFDKIIKVLANDCFKNNCRRNDKQKNLMDIEWGDWGFQFSWDYIKHLLPKEYKLPKDFPIVSGYMYMCKDQDNEMFLRLWWNTEEGHPCNPKFIVWKNNNGHFEYDEC